MRKLYLSVSLGIILFLFFSTFSNVVVSGVGIESARSDDYLTTAIQSQIMNLNPLTIQDVWSHKVARYPIYESLSDYHEETQEVVPWLAYDWSPIEASGDGAYEKDGNYTDQKVIQMRAIFCI